MFLTQITSSNGSASELATKCVVKIVTSARSKQQTTTHTAKSFPKSNYTHTPSLLLRNRELINAIRVNRQQRTAYWRGPFTPAIR